MSYLSKDDPELEQLVSHEKNRLDNTLNLIAAENHSPQSVLEVMGSVLNTKTIEGYPGKRFHAGCANVDLIENLAIKRGKSLFGAEYINVQPHSGMGHQLILQCTSVFLMSETVSLQ
jgi:glycine hydroxymethyltransferase